MIAWAGYGFSPERTYARELSGSPAGQDTVKVETRHMDGTRREQIHPGSRVYIVLKKNQRSGTLTEGVVKDILTKSPVHPHGIKVRLEGGEVGRVKEIIQ